MNDKELMKNLICELNEASKLYYNGGESPLTDAEFDAKINQLKALEDKNDFIYCNSPTINVGAVPVLNGINTVEIKDKPMLSLDKVHTAEEIIKFSDGYDIIASIKCDGLSVRLIYENGDLISANTRGNGIIGSDIFEHIRYFTNVPLIIGKKERYIIDGEAIIYNKDFEIINKNGEFKNNRNTTSGSLALLDMSIVKNRRLSFIAWDIIEGGSYKEYHHNLEEAEEMFGFTVVPAFALDCTKVEVEEINHINENLMLVAEESSIPCDGVVWKINDIAAGDAKGRTAHHWCNAVAWKPAIEEYETELLDIELSMGRTGVLTPVAIVKPIEIDGAVIERCSLHNFSVMKDLLFVPWIGQKVWIYRANMIIPQISRADTETKPIDELRIFKRNEMILCPICGNPVFMEESDSGTINAICTNSACDGKLVNRIDHYCGKKGLDIKGISKATIEKLINWGWLNKLSDIYKLEQHSTEWKSKPGFGEASVNKIINTINATGRHPELDSFISALGIPLVGRTIAKTIAKEFESYQDFRDFVDTDDTYFWEFEGIGEEIDASLKEFDYTEADEIAEILEFKTPEVSTEETSSASAEGINFCVTGKVTQWKNRDELKSYIESIGGKVTSSVTSKTNYLINNDVTSSSAKNVSAKKLNIPIITEEEFIKMFK